ncbi:hypothetical protein [Nonomuraea phyllanthi]|uniref:hypothetical protein n=1 Tax=Nonomuraea phyllanthi TaxID=2219224 RepID=UPI001D132D67|nr:hypothetical protein [Nonomuraea phyllanthi]
MTATVLAGCLVLAAGCGAATSASPAAPTTPDKPPAVTDPVTTTPSTGPAKSPKPVKPTGDAVNVRKVRWTKAKPVSKGRKVQLTWWSGVAPCTVLDRVKVVETAKKVTITLYEGASPKAKDMACIMIAIEKTTTVTLKKPLGKRKIVDGTK